jgi:hypothetical protein
MPLLGIYRSIHHPTFPLTARVWVSAKFPPIGVEKNLLLATSFLERAVERVVEDVAE